MEMELFWPLTSWSPNNPHRRSLSMTSNFSFIYVTGKSTENKVANMITITSYNILSKD